MSTYQDSLSNCCEAVARTEQPTGILAGLRTAFERFRDGLRTRAALRQRRSLFLNVTGLDDRTLDDIGLTRSDVSFAANLPLEINASQAVREIAADRRARERRMRRR
jgi:uncharacterized protein YjiS (DUF1127 family)